MSQLERLGGFLLSQEHPARQNRGPDAEFPSLPGSIRQDTP